MDITAALAPKSDQLDAVDLVNPRTFTIADGSRLGTREGQTVAEVALVDFPRVWRPSKGMLDVLAKLWGTDGKAWVGRSVTLFNDPEVTFGKDKVGGIRISHLSHIDKATTVPIRGRGQGARKIQWKVEPLTIAAPAQPTAQSPTLLQQLGTAFQVAGITEPAKMLAYCNNLIGREITKAPELTVDEIRTVLDALAQDAAETGQA